MGILGSTITLPKLHKGQRAILKESRRFNVLQCGRRFGKTTMGIRLVLDAALAGCSVGWFAPTNKVLIPARDEIVKRLAPITVRYSKVEATIYLANGGTITFWSMEDPDAGRSRFYHLVVIDEAGIVRDFDVRWEQSIRATLSDKMGVAWFLGTPKGAKRYFVNLYNKGQENDPDWISWRRGSIDNPYMNPSEVEAAKRDLPAEVFDQEYRGIPADDGGNPFGLKAIRACYDPELQSGDAEAFGVDLAKSVDWTWILGLDGLGNEAVSQRFQMNWNDTENAVAETIGHTPSLVDSTGVGDPIVERLQLRCSDVEGFKFTSTSKQQLMEMLRADIQQGLFRFGDPILLAELESMEYQWFPTGVRYGAAQGMHDDGVMALALARRKWLNRNEGIGPTSSEIMTRQSVTSRF